MQGIGSLLQEKQRPVEKSAAAAKKFAASEWQDRASEIADKLGAKVGHKKRSVVFQMVKRNRTKAEASFRYITERENIKSPVGYFIWLMTQT